MLILSVVYPSHLPALGKVDGLLSVYDRSRLKKALGLFRLTGIIGKAPVGTKIGKKRRTPAVARTVYGRRKGYKIRVIRQFSEAEYPRISMFVKLIHT